MSATPQASSAATLQRPALAAVLVLAVAIGLTLVFWSPLWAGAGMVGGDIYSYYLPQKQFFAERLREGELPLWNNRTGFGYPLVAESQTGAFYPPHLLFYRTLDLNTAYNAIQLLHYVLAFAFTWLFARSLRLRFWGAGMAALVYTYGWFPSRLCWEWAIVCGAWLPLAFWCVERFLQSRHWRYLFLLSGTLALQVLPGHYHLAFMTQALVLVYVPVRLLLVRNALPPETLARRGRVGLALLLAWIGALGLSAVQWLPTWELRSLSQRAQVGGEHDPGCGYIPLWYLPQLVAPWSYYDGPLDLNAGHTGGPSTNQIEAHLYVGLIPLVLIAWGIVRGTYALDRRYWLWGALGLAALIYATGLLEPLARLTPGLNFFRGLGRYGVVTVLAAAVLAGASADGIAQRLPHGLRRALVVLLLLVTFADLWWVSRAVNVVAFVPQPPIARLSDSPVRLILARVQANGPVRLFARGANLPNLLSVSSFPVYLGLGPAEYFQSEPGEAGPPPFEGPATAAQIDWLRDVGVTHVLSFDALDAREWPVRLLWSGIDPFLNSSWGRREPLFLYVLNDAPGRLAWEERSTDRSARITAYSANRITCEVTTPKAGRLVLRDLSYPGWKTAVDDVTVPMERAGMFRVVDVPAGRHQIAWTYSPRWFWIGVWVSLGTFLLLATAAHVRYWHRRRTDSLFGPTATSS